MFTDKAMGITELRLILLALIGISVVVLVAYFRLRLRVNDVVQEEVALWKDRELERALVHLRQAAQVEAGASLERWRVKTEVGIRADAIRRSSAVVSGKVSEHLAPYMPGFPYNPKDARFLGTPIDFLVFDGMSDDDVREVVFLEIKTRGSSLTTRERRVRDAVLEGRVSWREFRIGGG
jgi:predicted Holliday junction resolvase-like endonuclease